MLMSRSPKLVSPQFVYNQKVRRNQRKKKVGVYGQKCMREAVKRQTKKNYSCVRKSGK